ncbi:Metallo-hydrolase/oxidoreductase [Basidiobolus meristosporus CBS 931.73]|uniref:Endoribonuclease YSH1 n=1 Tax=Basidiobolus meristosporus CBS 931.73 TaxID=1314790 RepID=A0A1Y1YS75_9FUNG|nr:Metallo-hydrolase/oxidoreductase [Basidiobolus meristosporus CBS 931.73]|eukprot:ORY00826.1 Metallo-hydrolase/oxidoreductase [Basidiobolus meristosporus CBS 931.73]
MAGVKRKPDVEIAVADENDVLQITALGAGNEVGRSCHILRYKGKTIMLDAGIHPGLNGLAVLPFFDEIDPSTVDVLLVTHFHLDHAASVPYFMEKTNFKGRVFMTHPTKAIYKWLLSDYVKVSNTSVDEMLYDEQDLIRSYERIEAVDYHQEIEVNGIKFTGFNAGHVLGACMFLIEIAGVKILYTGDYSREEDRHLMAAERPKNVQLDVLICESTYGVQSHEPRVEREHRFTTLVHDIVTRGGRCLIPVFALGRAQELLLILDEYWEAHPELESIPIYYASSLAKKCMAVYQTYINMMNAKIRKQFAVSNPFVFKHISNLRNMENFDDVGPCVMMASPGMLQNGLSRELLERWAPDKRNGVVITGYSVEGTLAKSILNEPEDFQSMSGTRIPLRMSVDYISFSAHVDYAQNSQFIDEVKAPNLVLVHGDSNVMGRLKSALQSRYAERDEEITIYTPKNCETISLYFRGEKMAKTIGNMAEKTPEDEQTISGILVAKDFQYNIMSAEDLNEFSGLTTSVVCQKLTLPYHAAFSLLKYHLEQMYDDIQETVDDEKGSVLRVFDTVDIKSNEKNQVTLEWIGNAMNDMIADSVLAIILNIESSPASVKVTHSPCHSHTHAHVSVEERTEELAQFLSKQFDQVNSEDHILTVMVDDQTASIDAVTGEVNSEHDLLKKRVTNVMNRVQKTLRPVDNKVEIKQE